MAVTAGEKAYAGKARVAINPAATDITRVLLTELFFRSGTFFTPGMTESDTEAIATGAVMAFLRFALAARFSAFLAKRVSRFSAL
jgi:uncharacterized membrane protein